MYLYLYTCIIFFFNHLYTCIKKWVSYVVSSTLRETNMSCAKYSMHVSRKQQFLFSRRWSKLNLFKVTCFLGLVK